MRPDGGRHPITVPSLLLVAAAILSPLLVGTVHPSTTVALAVLVVIALTAHVWSRRSPPLAIPWLGWLVLALPIWLLVTMLPLPPALAAALAPAAQPWWDTPLLDGIPVRSLSLSPGSTSFEVMKIVAQGGAFLLATQVAREPRGAGLLVSGLVLSGLVTLTISVVQTVTEPERLLWFYEPRHIADEVLQTPFVNHNHAAQFFELTGFAALGAAVGLRGRWLAIAAAAGLVLLGGLAVAGSDGGLVSLSVGVLFVVALIASRRGWRWVPWAVVATALAVAVWTGVGLQRDSAGDDPLVAAVRAEGKLAHMPGVVSLIADHPVTGVGRGAFHAAFDRYSLSGTHRYTHAESEPLQLACELGLPLSFLIIGLIAGTWGLALLRWRDDPAVSAALAAVLVVSWHGLAEFGLEFLGVGLPFAMALGVLSAPQQRGLVHAGRRVARALALLVALPLFLAPLALRHGTERQELDRLRRAEDTAAPEVYRDSLRWHPNSAHLTMAFVERVAPTADPAEVLPLVNRAMFLAPRDATPHLAAAEILAGMGARGQASLEAGLALDYNPSLDRRLFPLLRWSLITPGEVRRYVGPDTDRMADFAQFLLQEDRDSVLAREILADLSAEDAESPTVARLRATVLWSENHRDEALQALERSSAAHPSDAPLIRYYAKLLRSDGNPERALQVVETALSAAPEDKSLLWEKVATEIALSRHADGQRTLDRIRTLTTAPTPRQLARFSRTEGDLAAAQGRHDRARSCYLESLRYDADQPDVRLQLGKSYQELGRDAEALSQFRRVREQTDRYPFLDGWIEDLEARLGPNAR